jgi:hypothetical protein
LGDGEWGANGLSAARFVVEVTGFVFGGFESCELFLGKLLTGAVGINFRRERFTKAIRLTFVSHLSTSHF